MAIKLEATIKRYIGLSSDIKPRSGEFWADGTFADTIPAGSSFLETDTGRIYRWDGGSWESYVPLDEQVLVLQAILETLSRISTQIELGSGIEAESLAS